MRNDAMLNSQKTIEIQDALGNIWYIPCVVSKKIQENFDTIIKDRNMVARAFLTEKGADARGLGVETKSDPSVSEKAVSNKRKFSPHLRRNAENRRESPRT